MVEVWSVAVAVVVGAKRKEDGRTHVDGSGISEEPPRGTYSDGKGQTNREMLL